MFCNDTLTIFVSIYTHYKKYPFTYRVFILDIAQFVTQSPIQWVSEALFLEEKRPGREAYPSLPSSAKVKE